MHVPRVVVGVCDLGPDDLDHACAGLNEAACKQAALAKGVAAVKIAGGLGLLCEVERVARAAGGHEVESAVIVIVQLEIGYGLVDVWRGVVDGVTKTGTTTEAQLEHVGAHLEVVGLDAVHLVHVHVAAVRVEVVRVE